MRERRNLRMMTTPNRVKDIYEYCKEMGNPMLTAYPGDFWEVYADNYTYFDRLFMRSYKEFRAFSLDSDDVEDNAVEWFDDVYAWLLANDKRYSELWRMQVVSDTDYSILDNYNVRETHSTEGEKSVSDNYGSKTDTESGAVNYGSMTVSENNSLQHGQKSEQDSETREYGIDVTTTEVENMFDDQQNTSEDKVSADNVSTYSPKAYTETNLGTHTDTSDTTETRSAREDSVSSSHTEAGYIDSEQKAQTHSSHNDTKSNSIVHGAHLDTHNTEESENRTVTRVGNIGVFSASKLLGEHEELWVAFNFYKMIFDEIANEFLRIVY